MNLERFSNIGNQGEQENVESGKLRKTINATIITANIVGATMAIPGEAEAQDRLASTTTLPQIEIKKSSIGGSMSIEKLDQSVFSYIKNLGVFGKLSLVNDIKEHGNEIKAFLSTGIDDTEKTQAILKISGVELKTVLSRYTRGLRELDATLRDRAISKISDLITTVQNSSISELQDKFK